MTSNLFLRSRAASLPPGSAAVPAASFLLLLLLLLPLPALALDPAKAAITNLRAESSAQYVSQEEFFRGTTLLLTNCIAYAGPSTSSARQDLTGLALALSLGTVQSNLTNTAYASDPTNGLWWAAITVPTNWESPNLQLKLSDTNAPPFIYPWKILKTKAPL